MIFLTSIKSSLIVKNNLSIYIHYPFCKSKCPYCDFNSHVYQTIDHQSFLQGYLNELDFFAKKIGKRKIKTIFFGGGTPSLMPIFLIEGILKKISQIWQIDKNCEISLEANPTSFEAKKFQEIKLAGVNRLSIGIQSLDDKNLKFLGRNHNAKEAINTIETAAKIFDNFSFDLIYALPNQNINDWKKELKQAIKFNTKHLSLYQLTIEKGTKFYRDFLDKKFIMLDENISAEFYETTNQITKENGFDCYEISNYCKKDFSCKHNLVYWQGADYLGIGAGAHSRIYLENEKERSSIFMTHEPNLWLKKTQTEKNGIQKIEKISQENLLEELILMGLRLKNGITNKIFLKHFNKKINQLINLEKLENLKKAKLISIGKNYLKITKKGRIITNSIIEKIIYAKR